MSTTKNRGGGAKFLALMSSLAMITVGLIGVAFASPANADDDTGPEPKIWVCHADMNNGHGQPNLGEGGTGGEYQVGFNLIWISKSAWEAGAKDGHDQHPNDVNLGERAHDDEPTLEDCGGDVTVECPEGQDWDGEQCVTPKKIWICHVPQGQEDKYLLLEVDENAWQEGESAHSQHQGDYVAAGGDDPSCSPPQPETRTVWWCAAEGQAASGEQEYVDDAWTPEYNGGDVSETELTDADCTTPPPPPNPPSNPPGGPPASPPAPTCANDTDRPGFTIPAGQDASWCNVAVEQVTTVVAPATVVAPQAATAPAKKPAKAVLPATVPAGVAVVPGASNLPGSVPAGDGSSQGGTPPWAFLLVVAGALGVLSAAGRMLVARK